MLPLLFYLVSFVLFLFGSCIKGAYMDFAEYVYIFGLSLAGVLWLYFVYSVLKE